MRSKIKFLFLLMLGLLFLNTGCKKAESDNPTPTPTPTEKYDVKYVVNFNKADYENLKISYMNNDQSIVPVENPPKNWEINFSDFKKGDSLVLSMEFLSIPVDTLIIEHCYGYKTSTDDAFSITGSTDTIIQLEGGHLIKRYLPGTIQ